MIQEWRDQALCAGQAPAFDAYIYGETVAQQHNRIEAAKAVCAVCPVAAACAQDAVYGRDSGVRAGRVIAPVVPPKPRTKGVREHGSEKGYRQHYALKDRPACRDCKTAHVAFLSRERRRKLEAS